MLYFPAIPSFFYHMNRRMDVPLDETRYELISSNYKSLNYSTMSKLVLAAIDEFLAKYLSKEVQEPKTDEAKLAAIVGKMGRIREENHAKFVAITGLRKAAHLKRPSTESEIKSTIEVIWKAVVQKGGVIKRNRKAVAITLDDLKKYEMLCRMEIEKDILDPSTQAPSASTSSV